MFLHLEPLFVLYGFLYCSAWAHFCLSSSQTICVVLGFLSPKADSSQTVSVVLPDSMFDGQKMCFNIQGGG